MLTPVAVDDEISFTQSVKESQNGDCSFSRIVRLRPDVRSVS
tara:strand:+ start:2421 stop:2546 length:126 start_codon:yes stop_codon:yes gene_type:complete